jgi:hypothetical protein
MKNKTFKKFLLLTAALIGKDSAAVLTINSANEVVRSATTSNKYKTYSTDQFGTFAGTPYKTFNSPKMWEGSEGQWDAFLSFPRLDGKSQEGNPLNHAILILLYALNTYKNPGSMSGLIIDNFCSRKTFDSMINNHGSDLLSKINDTLEKEEDVVQIGRFLITRIYENLNVISQKGASKLKEYASMKDEQCSRATMIKARDILHALCSRPANKAESSEEFMNSALNSIQQSAR